MLVEEGMDGFTKGNKLKKMGMKAQDTSELFFDDVQLTDDNILGGADGKNKGFYQVHACARAIRTAASAIFLAVLFFCWGGGGREGVSITECCRIMSARTVGVAVLCSNNPFELGARGIAYTC